MNFPLFLSLIISAFCFVVIEKFEFSFSFLFFALALIENAYSLRGSTSEVVSSQKRDFRFSYASLNSKYIYAFSLIVAYVSIFALRFYLAGSIAIVSFLIYAFLFVVFRLASSELLSYFDKSIVVKSQDYKPIYALRQESDIQKKDVIASINKCMLMPGLSKESIELLDTLSETIKFSSLVSQSSLSSLSDLMAKLELNQVDESAMRRQIEVLMSSI